MSNNRPIWFDAIENAEDVIKRAINTYEKIEKQKQTYSEQLDALDARIGQLQNEVNAIKSASKL